MSKSTEAATSRRTVFAGAGALGALAAAASLLPATPKPAVQTAAAQPTPTPEGGGYQLTEHVKQYYATARI